MLEILYNDYIAAAVNTMGAELWSLKRREDDREFLWQGDKEIWPRRAPILFRRKRPSDTDARLRTRL